MLDLKSRLLRGCVSVKSLLRRPPGPPVATGRRASYSAFTIRRLCWLLNGCLLTTSLTFGQEVASHYVHEAWTIEDGLPLNGITRLIQSRDGYLWMSTFDGLARFDGPLPSRIFRNA